MIDLVWLIPVMPLVGFLINGLLARRFQEQIVGWIGALSVGASFVVAVLIFKELLGMEPAASRLKEVVVYSWMASGNFSVNIGFLVDPLSMIMMLVVTGVGFLIHVYSIGYMHGEFGFRRFFCYLNLFVFNMLLLVCANNFLLMFVGWEGVGLCSYLLIGYYYEKQSASDAGKKAFVVNRVGDFGFLLGIFLIFKYISPLVAVGPLVGSLDFVPLFKAAPTLPHAEALMTLITLCLFVGATGKSAQIPLYTWLPDAMEGPTPVSALIHAATMVTAGVYMVARCSVMFAMAPTSMTVVAIIGGLTALYAATIGMTQFDIKRVLAYSTISQLGYMFLACGVGAFASGIFHLMTHAFFKALLFLSAGSVMHAMSGELDMRKMGALRHHIPYTFWTYVVGTIAISGIPPLAGFFSKDEILLYAFLRHPLFWAMGALAAVMTSFYMFRTVFMTFCGESRVEEHAAHHLHESPPLIIIPLVILACLATVGGFVGFPMVEGWHVFGEWLTPVFAPAKEIMEAAQHGHVHAHPSDAMELGLMAVSVGIAIVGLVVAYWMYIADTTVPDKVVEAFPEPHRLVYNKYWMDEVYDFFFVNSIVGFSRFLWKRFDVLIVDGIVNGVAWLTRGFGLVLSWFQTGLVKDYALSILVGLVAVIGYLVLKMG